MKIRKIATVLLFIAVAMTPTFVSATKFLELKVIDKDYLMVHFRDGEVRYRDDGTGPSAYLGHSFAEGDDTLLVFGQRLDPAVAAKADSWTITSADDKSFGNSVAVNAWRKSKPMNTDNTLTSELDHWIFLQLPKSMKQGCTYTVSIPNGLGSDTNSAEVKFDIWNSQSEAVTAVTVLGYSATESKQAVSGINPDIGVENIIKEALKILNQSGEGKQVILFTCQSREQKILEELS